MPAQRIFQFVCYSMIFFAPCLFAQEKSQQFSLETLSVEELLNIQTVTIATKKAQTARETPGIVSVITDEDIKHSGARDMIDVLRLVPGFEFGLDVTNVVGAGIRGNWGHEGKILLLVDGQEFNENLFGTLQFGNRFALEHIKKIEIIRGPGSAIYGGQAALAVINIISKTPDEHSGVSVGGQYGQIDRAFGRRNINLGFGKKFGAFGVSATAFFGEGNRSDRTYADFQGGSFDMKNASELNPFNINIGVAYQSLSLRFIADNYVTTNQDGYGEITEKPIKQTFSTFIGDAKYDLSIGGNFVLTPRLTYKRQAPWSVTDTAAADVGNKTVDRFTSNLTAQYDLNKNINLLFGSEFYFERAKVGSADTPDAFFGENQDQESITYNNIAFFAQGLFNLQLANLTIGARYDNQSAFGDAFVPRIALTRVFDKFHVKLLASRAFRAPNIENIRLNPSIQPEFTTVFEAEFGYQIAKSLALTVNIFDVTIDQPIIYFSEGEGENLLEGYRNFDQTGTRGFEVEARFRESWGYATANYSFYSAADKNRVESYRVVDNKNLLLGFAQHKIAFNGSVRIGKFFSINPSLIYLGERDALTGLDSEENFVLSKFSSKVLANLFLYYTGISGTEVGIGVYDAFNSNYSFIQPYSNGSAPLPATNREIIARFSYRFGL